VSVSFGSTTITGTGTTFTAYGIRSGDPIRLSSGGSVFLGQVASVDSNTQITVMGGVVPLFTSASAAWAIGCGDGIHQERSVDNNVFHLDNCKLRGSAGFGLKLNGVNSSTVTNCRWDVIAFGGVAYGDRNGVNVCFGSSLVTPYFEGDFPTTPAHIWVNAQLGLSIIEPSGASPVFSFGIPSQVQGIIQEKGVIRDLISQSSMTVGGGSPEGVVTATVGSIHRRTDGGAGTTFYVKESGAGNTGWVAK
jgi:hypothetical protein